MNTTRTTFALRAALVPAALALLTVTATGAAAAPSPDKMPDVTGKSLATAYDELDYDTSIRMADARGAHRHILWPANWKVCAQDPAPGADIRKLRITLKAVKHEEKCP